MPKHVARLLLLIAAAAVAAVAARYYFTDPSYYRYGPFRGDAPAEIAADVPIYKGPEYCQSCHAERFAQWSAGVHAKAVRCETCHGAAALHPVSAGIKPPPRADGGVHAGIASDERFARLEKVSIPGDSAKLCTLCHEKTAGRPALQKQIELGSHAKGAQCIACHNAHSPRIAGVAAVQKTAAVTPLEAGDPAAGEKKAAACAACHGKDGLSSNPQWPSLAGQPAQYLAASLRAYRTGSRPNPLMAGPAKALSDGDIDDLSAYFAGLTCRPGPAPGSAEQAAAGKAKAAPCAACHGGRGLSANPAWPHLAGQQETYLAEALRAYRGEGRPGTAMSGLAKPLSDGDISQLAAYYAGLDCKP